MGRLGVERKLMESDWGSGHEADGELLNEWIGNI